MARVQLNPRDARASLLVRAWLALMVCASTACAEPCQIARFPDIAVTMSGLQPMVHAQINGQDVLLVADSGAFFSTLTPAAAQQFQLPSVPLAGLWVEG